VQLSPRARLHDAVCFGGKLGLLSVGLANFGCNNRFDECIQKFLASLFKDRAVFKNLCDFGLLEVIVNATIRLITDDFLLGSLTINGDCCPA